MGRCNSILFAELFDEGLKKRAKLFSPRLFGLLKRAAIKRPLQIALLRCERRAVGPAQPEVVCERVREDLREVRLLAGNRALLQLSERACAGNAVLLVIGNGSNG